MYRVSLIGDQDPYANVQAFARRYPELVLDAAQRRLQPRGDRLVQQQLVDRTPPPRREGEKIRWTSEKQRKAFFATDGFGHGIPYKRTKRLENAWQFVLAVTPNGLTASVVNNAPAAPFVVGRWQQGFHFDHGWPQAGPIITTIGQQLQAVIVEIPGDVIAGIERR